MKIVKIRQSVIQAAALQHTTQGPQCNPHSIGTAEAAKLATPAQMRFQIDKKPGNVALGDAPVDVRQLAPQHLEYGGVIGAPRSAGT